MVGPLGKVSESTISATRKGGIGSSQHQYGLKSTYVHFPVKRFWYHTDIPTDPCQLQLEDQLLSEPLDSTVLSCYERWLNKGNESRFLCNGCWTNDNITHSDSLGCQARHTAAFICEGQKELQQLHDDNWLDYGINGREISVRTTLENGHGSRIAYQHL